MDVLVTGAYGRCGTAIIDYLDDDSTYSFTYLDRSENPDDPAYADHETHVADIADYDRSLPAFDGQDAIVHLAANPNTFATWDQIIEPNVVGMYNALEGAKSESLESFVFASTNHVMGMYERENAPEIYGTESDILLDHSEPPRPDSFYGASKSFGEDLGRYYVENHEYPKRFYALRICSVRLEENDHPYGDAERAVDRGEFERGSPRYEETVARMKGMWHSRRDFAHLVDRCLRDDTVSFDIFSGVSKNDRRWFDITHAGEVLGYHPQDNGEEWDAPPEVTA